MSKTIVLTITVPDGVTVDVRQSQGAATRQAPTPEGGCPIHGVAWKIIPAGFSKTKFDDNGNPKHYDAFATCSERGCNEKPQQNQQASANNAPDDPFGDLPL